MELYQLREGGDSAVDQLVQQRQLIRQTRNGHEVSQVARQEGSYPPPQGGRAVGTFLQLGHHPGGVTQIGWGRRWTTARAIDGAAKVNTDTQDSRFFYAYFWFKTSD